MTGDLFERKNDAPQGVPLADRLRPRTLDEILGQDEAVGPGSFLRLAIERDAIAATLDIKDTWLSRWVCCVHVRHRRLPGVR